MEGGHDNTAELLRRYHEHGDIRARDVLVERHLSFARKLAARYSHTDEPLADLVQVASVGLLKAIDRFDPRVGRKFTNFAAPTILGELKRYFRDSGWALRVPRDLQERAIALRHATDELSTRLGRSPSVRELAHELDWLPEQVLEAREAGASYRTTSLDGRADSDSDSDPFGDGLALVDRLGAEDDGFDLVEEHVTLVASWQTLPALERQVLHLRFFDDLSQREVGERIGYSQMHVSRLIHRALERLRLSATSMREAA